MLMNEKEKFYSLYPVLPKVGPPEIVVNKVYFPDYDKHYEAYRAMQEKLKLGIREDIKHD